MLIAILLSLTLTFDLAFALQEPAASKPDFTGIWNARVLVSDREPTSALKIAYSDPKLEIWRMRISQQPAVVLGQSLNTRSANRFVYYTDGRGETHKSERTFSGESIKTNTERIGKKFIITEGSTKGSDGKIVADQTTTIEVSADGKTLTETMRWFSEGNSRRVVHIYDRIAGNNTNDINGEWARRKRNRVISLTIEHRDPEIKVTRREISEAQDESEVLVYYTDGRGETNVQGGRSVKSVTKWKNNTLVFAFSTKTKTRGDRFEFNDTIKWQIGKDGEGLVEVSESRITASPGFVIPPVPNTLVYARSKKPFPG